MELTWLMFYLLGAVAVAQALLDGELALWPIAGALVVLGTLAFQRRRPSPEYRVMVETSAGQLQAFATGSAPEARLVQDAILSALPLESPGRRQGRR
jgi:hypothetical protein